MFIRNLVIVLTAITSLNPVTFAAVANRKPDAFPEGEKLVFSKLLSSFRKGDVEDVTKQKKLLEDKYPTSVHLDSAYYLLGALEYQQGHLGEALRAFDKVVNQYTLSSKRSGALFGMGMTYKKLNLFNQAQAVFHRILELYPGSPEAQRASLEIRLTDQDKASAKNRTE